MFKMKKRTYIVRCYINVTEEEVLDYTMAAKGCEDENEFLKGYTITDRDWRDCALEKFGDDEYNYDRIDFLNETDE
jgi:hypothetical protein